MRTFRHRLIVMFFFQLADHLIDPSFITHIGEMISNQTHEKSYYCNVKPPPDQLGTTHVSIMDEDGLVVSATSTINQLWAGRGHCLILRKLRWGTEFIPSVYCVRLFCCIDSEEPFTPHERASSSTMSWPTSVGEQTQWGQVKSQTGPEPFSRSQFNLRHLLLA